MYSHTRMCFQISSAFLLRNLSVWEICFCWVHSHRYWVHCARCTYYFSRQRMPGYRKNTDIIQTSATVAEG